MTENQGLLFFDAHTHSPYLPGSVSVVNLEPMQVHFPNSWASAGIHPWRLMTETFGDEEWLEWVRGMCDDSRILAIGECGLDGPKGGDPHRQLFLLLEQCKLALEFGLPVILHAVKSDHLLLPLIRSHPEIQFVFHGFSGKWSRATEYLKLGVMISFGPGVQNSSRAVQSLKECPVSLMLLETDNSGISISDWYEKVAVLKGCSLEQLLRNMENNFIRIFNRYE